MAGHSKWANIQHRKRAQDTKRGKLFTKLIREITVAARMGGSDASANPRLRLAMDKGLAANMPKDTIERAIKRGAGELDDVHYEEVRYEGYGPGGTAIMVDCMTDNRKRTVAEVRHVLSKHGGNLGTDGSVAYLFNAVGVLMFVDVDEDSLLEAAMEAGAEDLVADDEGTVEVLTAPDEFVSVRDALVAAGFQPQDAEVSMRASAEVSLDEEAGRTLLKILDALEELEDVQNVYSNGDIPDAVLDELAA